MTTQQKKGNSVFRVVARLKDGTLVTSESFTGLEEAGQKATEYGNTLDYSTIDIEYLVEGIWVVYGTQN